MSQTRPPQIRIVDSITELSPCDGGCIAVSGSHGGVSSARYAAAVRPVLCVFNDAGVGKEQAGIAALQILQASDLAACTVGHDSACIGNAQSTLATGRISHVNACAATLGIHQGQSCRNAVMMASRTNSAEAQHHAPSDSP